VNGSLDRLFKPRSIAVIGATPKKKWGWSSGNSWISGSIAMGMQGAIFPVHPSADSIMGYRAYKTVLDIPGEVDLAIVAIPLSGVIDVLQQCIEKRIRFVHLLTAGFSETGREELGELEAEIIRVAQSGGIRLIGPNCMGIYCPEGGLSWNSRFPSQPGNIGMFSQSGQLAYEIITTSRPLTNRFSKVVSFGNAGGIKAAEFLSYLAEDENTRIIAAYLEGLRDGRAFFEAARGITRRKPLVVWKGGQTAGGSRATRSHTAAIAGSQAIWDAMCRQTGIIPVQDVEEMIYTLQALDLMELPQGNRVVVLGGAGGGSVTMTDAAEKEGLVVPLLAEETIAEFDRFVPLAGSSAKNPMDIMPVLFNEQLFHRVMELLSQDPATDAVIFRLDPGWLFRDLGRPGLQVFADNVISGVKASSKPFFIALYQRNNPQIEFIREQLVDIFNRARIPTFPGFSMAARVLANLNRYRDFLEL